MSGRRRYGTAGGGRRRDHDGVTAGPATALYRACSNYAPRLRAASPPPYLQSETMPFFLLRYYAEECIP